MSVRDDIYAAILAWLQAAPLSLTSAQVIRARQSGDAPRPAEPYLTVLLPVLDVPTSQDWHVETVSGSDPVRQLAGARTGTLSIQGSGGGADEWLADAELMLGRHDVNKALNAAGVALDRTGGLTDLSAVLDTGFEQRYSAEYTVRYGILSAAETLIPVEEIVTTTTYTSDTSGDLVVANTISI